MTQPGFGFAGFSGIAVLGLGFYGLTVVPWSFPGKVLRHEVSLLTGGSTAMPKTQFRLFCRFY